MNTQKYNELVKVIQSAVPEIINRPITLEDCLIALNKKERPVIWVIDIYGQFFDRSSSDGSLIYLEYWKLNKSLNEQNDKTKQFLFDILLNK